MALPPLPLVVLDTETTGFVPGPHKMIELAFLRVEKGRVVDTFEQLLQVEDELPPHVQTLTRIRPEDLQGKPFFATLREDVAQRIGGEAVLVGQNLGFDLGFLKREGIDCSERAWVDTSMLASLAFPECASYSLGYLSATLGLPHEPQHRALGDVRATLALLERVWDRLRSLPSAQRDKAKRVMERAPEGYQRLFDALPPAKETSVPAWFCSRSRPPVPHTGVCRSLAAPPPGTIDIADDTLAPDGLGCILAGAVRDTSVRRWIAVKNLASMLRRFTPPDGARAVWSPSQLPDPEAVERLLSQTLFTADEASLALKLSWFSPQCRDAVALHGGEKDVWNGKIACTDASAVYQAQLADGARTLLLDHRHLLTLISNPPAGIAVPSANDHVIIDDASMLEDTATKAFGISLSLDDVRAAAQGNDTLMRIADIAELWAGKVRRDIDQHMVIAQDLAMRETKGMQELLAAALDAPLPQRTRELLKGLQSFVDIGALPGMIAWIEARPNGTQILQRAPDAIGAFLSERLYTKTATTLLAPPRWPLVEVLPKSIPIREAELSPPAHPPIALTFPEDTPIDTVLANPPAGRTIGLLGSKRVIEQAYIRWTERLEEKGVQLICQGFAGGQGRMESEFLAAPHAILLLTPWMYEGSDLPAGSVDHLVFDTLPFDHPGHPVIHHRAERYQNGFMEYSLPRLMHRLFRLLRTFARHRTSDGDIIVLDNRIRNKTYGPAVKHELEKLCAGDGAPPKKIDGPLQQALL